MHPDTKLPIESLRLHGTVSPSGSSERAAVVVRTDLSLEGKRTASHRSGTRFRMTLADGSAVDVDLPEKPDDLCLPNTKISSRWSKLETRDESTPFRSHAPGPDVLGVIEGFVLRAGDDVIVYGDVLERAFAEHTEGMRSTPGKRVSHVRARMVAAGTDAAHRFATEFAKRFPPVERPAISRVDPFRVLARLCGFMLIVALAILAWVAIGTDYVAVRFNAIITSLVIAASYVFALVGAGHPRFGAGQERSGGLTPEDASRWIGTAVILLTLLLFSGIELLADARAANTGVRMIAFFDAIYVAALIGWHPFLARAGRRDVALLLDAPPFDGRFEKGRWGRAVGTVRDSTPITVQGEEAALAREHDITDVPGSDPDIVKSTFHNRETFLLEASDAIFEIVPDGALWASSERDVTSLEKGHRIERELVPLGARLVVAGRIDRTSEGLPLLLRAKGERSLIFFATRADRDPLTILRRLRVMHSIAFALLLAIAAAGVAVSFEYVPLLPPARESSD